MSIVSKIIDDSADIIIVGAGPVGLWTAAQIKVQNPERNIVIAEKREDEKRTQPLRIALSSLKGAPKHEGIDALIKKWGNKTVPITTIKNDLIKVVNDLGIKVIFKEIDPKELKQAFPQAQVFIGADGSRSPFRQTFFKDKFRFNSELQHLAQVQYTLPKDAYMAHETKLKGFSNTYRTMKFAEHLVEETIKKQEDGSFKITLRIFISEKTYNEISSANFKNPYTLTDFNKFPKKLNKVLIRWLGSHEFLNKAENRHIQNSQVTAIALKSYASKYAVKQLGKDNIVALVGDSFSGFPYFRSVNTGFLLGTKLAKTITHAFKRHKKQLPISSFDSYKNYALIRVYIERVKAFVKTLFIRIGHLFIKMSNRVPWQTNKWSDEEKKDIQQKGKALLKRLKKQAAAEAFSDSHL